jgi:hypothetical protein
MQRFSHLDIRTKYQYLTGITTVIPIGRLFDTIINVGSPIYQTNIGKNLRGLPLGMIGAGWLV